MEKTKTWELAKQHVNSIEKAMEEEYKENKWPAMVGVMESQLSHIFITLSVYHPEAYERILNQLELTP